jgi:putative DNA primase/helicase
MPEGAEKLPIVFGIKRPGFASYEARVRLEQDPEPKPPGLYFHDTQLGRHGEPVVTDRWVCGPIECEASTSDEQGDNFGLLVKFQTLHGNWREWALPLRLLRGNGDELRGELLNMGLKINPDAHRLLNKWFAGQEPATRLLAATRVGWHRSASGPAFVMPRRTLGAEDIVYQCEAAAHDDFEQAGSLEEWREKVGALCSGNPLLLLAVSTALAGPLLHLTHRKGVGLHFVGDSSSGKTTLLEVAASVWGGPNFILTWRATVNGLEGVAAARSDTCLILDEIGEADGRNIGQTIYALGNGTGKSRANRAGRARKAFRWRVALLSSGERSLAAHMGEVGHRPKSGQSVRLLDILAKRTHGAFDQLHDHHDGRSFSDHLKSIVQASYGHLGPAFVEVLLGMQGSISERVEALAQDDGFSADTGLQGRAAKALVLIGLAGEIATEHGLTGWQPSEALHAASEAFQAWKAYQGESQSEHQQILESVRSFISRHGDARFSSIEDPSSNVRDRAGWWRQEEGVRVYLLTAEGLREAIGHFDTRRGLDAIDDAGWLVDKEGGNRSIRIRVNGIRVRVYAIVPYQDAGL